MIYITKKELKQIGFLKNKIKLNEDVYLKFQNGKINLYSGDILTKNLTFFSETSISNKKDLEIVIKLLKSEFS